MANRILVTQNQLESSSKKFQQTAQQIEGLIRTLDSELGALKTGWEGLASDKFTQHWEGKGKKDFMLMMQLSQQFAQKLDTVAKQMADMDRQLASQMGK